MDGIDMGKKLDKQILRWYQQQDKKLEIGKQWNGAKPCAIATKDHPKREKIPLIIHTPELIVVNKIENLMKKIGYDNLED
jgi:hypothetical protein